MIDTGHEAADREIGRISRRLHKIYSEAADEVGKDWKAYMKRLEKEDKQLQKRIDNATDANVRAELIASRKQLLKRKTLMNSKYRAFTEQMAREITNVNETAAEYVNGRAPKVYADNWNYNGKNIEYQTGAAVRFDIINPHTVEELVKDNANFLPEYHIDPKKDIPWNIEKINSAVAKGIVKGESIPKIAGSLKEVCGMNEKAAVRSARTIVTSVENKARMDSAKEAEDRGVIMYKEWIAYFDNRVRDWHRDAGHRYGTREKAIPLHEKFIVKYNKKGDTDEMDEPGDMSAHSSNLYNCRCAMATIPKGFTSILPPERRGKIHVRFID